MSDERGGRYFGPARFFLAGDKVAAQSHILDARMVLGALRDRQVMGGPAIQTQYAMLPDGTRIKATMMNGQFQAEIVSQSRRIVPRRDVIPTIGGTRRYTAPSNINIILRDVPFKWQESTGIVYLQEVPGYTIATVDQVSRDGSTVGGTVRNPNTGASEYAFWDSTGTVTMLGTFTGAYILDITENTPEMIPTPTVITTFGGWRRYLRVEDGMYFYGTYDDGGTPRAVVVHRALDGTETVVLQETTGSYSDVTGLVESGSVAYGVYSPTPLVVDPVVRWNRAPLTGVYTRSAPIHPDLGMFAYPDSTGSTFVSRITRIRTVDPSHDIIPAVYDVATGTVEQLETFIVPETVNLWQIFDARCIFSGGGLVAGVGSYSLNPTRPMAWKRNDAGVWAHVVALDRPFDGQCTAIN